MAAPRPAWAELAGRYGLVLRLQGGQLRGPCPLHDGLNPTSFVVDPERGLFYCHACGEGGGIATFIRLMEGGEGSRGDQHLQDGRGWRRHSPGPPELARLAQTRIRALGELPEVEPVLGPDSAHPYYQARGINPATVATVGGGVYLGPEPFHRRAVFPVWTPEGRLVGHVGRAIDPDVTPRYVCERGFRRALLLYNEIDPDAPDQAITATKTAVNRTVIVVEGPFDVLAVIQAGFPNVVALLGCVASDFQLAALSRYRGVVSLLDADDAGRNGARLLRRVLRDTVNVLDMGEGDPASVGRDRLVALLGPS